MAKAVGQYTIADLTDGSNGKSAIQAILSNENHTLTADASGTPISYTGCSTTITVYEGTTDVTSQYTIARSAATGITTTISGSTITVTAVTNGVGGNVVITATKGSTVLTKVFTISVSKTGQQGQQGQTGQTGPAGADAKLVIINPSSQVFKSTTGSTGTFSPQYIYLYPSFQGCSYSKWQYSTNGTSWTDVVSGSNSLTIATYNSVANSLRIERTCNLYTSSVTAISFRCVSSDATIYDTVTILKVYDATDTIIRSDTEPSNPSNGDLWFNTNDNTLRMYDSTVDDWVYQDTSDFITDSDLNAALVNKSKTWIVNGSPYHPTPPYNVGDIWIITEGNDAGKIKTCLQSRSSSESYNADDWYTPTDAYTTVTQMTNVIGKDPTEWSTTSTSLTQMINENTNEIVGAKAQAAKLAVRASDIEMSFSRTGTMNFLGNSSGQNAFDGWVKSFVNSSTISQIRDDDLVAGYGFRVAGTYSDWNSLGSSDTNGNGIYAIPPAGDFFTVSFKLKNQCPYSYVMIEAVPYDITGTRLDGGNSINTGWLKTIPYTSESAGSYVLFHFVGDKRIISSLKSIKIAVFFGKVGLNTEITTRPTWNDSYINELIKEGSTYYYGASSYTKMTIIEQDEVPTLSTSQVWKCTNNIVDENTGSYLYMAGFYYELDTSGNLVPVIDNYDITMLDKDNYYKIIGTGWVDVTSRVVNDVLQPEQTGQIFFGDIMFNGGQMVQTWTPRQDENLWGTNIKFNEKGITLQSSNRKRQLNETSDIAWQLDSSGNIVSCIWTLTDSGFITNDIKCYGSFYMGYVPDNSFDETSMNEYFDNHKVLEMSKANDGAGQGINEYIYSS